MRFFSMLVLGSALLAACGDNGSSAQPGDDQPVEDCSTTGDEDGNGAADCDDAVCKTLPACDGTVKPVPGCGNNKVEGEEKCDDGNTTEGDGCDTNCTLSACGNGVKAGSEACDDGNDVEGDGCDNNCTATACGNGVITGNEVCDDGNTIDGDGCDSNCRKTGCGNGVPAGDEACDDGNDVNGDGCDNNCTATACGNGITTMNTGEACDDGNAASWDACSNVCTASLFTYVKASNAEGADLSGWSVALSADGKTLAVGAIGESSNGGGEANNASMNSGAVYVYARTGETWTQQAYLKASNAGADDQFGQHVALSADGSTLVVGAIQEDGNGQDPASNAIPDAGAAYVFTRTGDAWAQSAYLKAPTPHAKAKFGYAVAIAGDGKTLAVGAIGEETGGVTYVFGKDAAGWPLQDSLKGGNTQPGDSFGESVALSTDGATLAVGATGEKSASADPNDNTTEFAGAAYVFKRDATWSQSAYLKAEAPEKKQYFGTSVTLSGDGKALAVGAPGASGFKGAAYVFGDNGTQWTQTASLTVTHGATQGQFGFAVSLSVDGKHLAIGSVGDASNATGVRGDETDTSKASSGAAFVFARGATAWTQDAYVKALNTDANDFFGRSVSLSADGGSLAVGAPFESSNSTTINMGQTDNSANSAGAAYIYQ